MKPRVVYDVKDSEYYAEDRLSFSTAHLLLTRSPLHAKLALRKSRKPRGGMARGTLFDELLTGGDRIDVLDFDAFRSNEAKAARDEALAAGKVPVKRHEYDAANEVAEIIRGQLHKHGLDFSKAKRQVAIFWNETATDGANVPCRCRIDALDLPTIWDLKTISSADDETCARHAESYGYVIQAAAYTRACEAAFPEWAGRLRFIDAFMEVDEPPYLVNPKYPDAEAMQVGNEKWQVAVDRWSEATQSKEWPGYSRGITPLELPRYAIAQHEKMMAEYQQEEA